MSQEDTEDLGTTENEQVENETEGETIEAPKPKATRYKKASEGDGRKKKGRTPAQIAAFEKCRAKREANRKLRREEDEAVAAEQKAALEEKVVKKAVKVRKKQVIREAVLDDVSSDSDDSDIDIQAVRKLIKQKKQRAKRQPSRPVTPPPSPTPAAPSIYFI